MIALGSSTPSPTSNFQGLIWNKTWFGTVEAIAPLSKDCQSRAGLNRVLAEDFSLHMPDSVRAKTGQLQSNKHSTVVSLNDFQLHAVLSESQNITSHKHLKTYINFTMISSQVSSDFSTVNKCHLKFIRKSCHSFRKKGTGKIY